MMEHRNKLSGWVVNASMLLYMAWLLLPTAQVSLHAITGAATIAVFGIGVLLDGVTLRKDWRGLLLRILMTAALPAVLLYFLERGGNEKAGFYVQQCMFWFPLVWCAYARIHNDPRIYRWVFQAFLILVLVTTATTIYWLLENLLKENPDYSYARELIHSAESRQDLRNTIMLRNIGGYGFIYLVTLLLPVIAYEIILRRGWKRAGFLAVYALLMALIALAQFTYALVFALTITAMELLSALFRKIWKRLPILWSFLLTLPLFILLFVFREPLVAWLANAAEGLKEPSIARSLNSLLVAVSGDPLEAGSRLNLYLLSVDGFKASPWIGSVFSDAKSLSQHSELLDLLSGLGIAGTLLFAAGAWLIGLGSAKGIFRIDKAVRPHLWLQWAVFLVVFTVNTVFYSRELSLVMCLSIAYILKHQTAAPPEIKKSVA